MKRLIPLVLGLVALTACASSFPGDGEVASFDSTLTDGASGMTWTPDQPVAAGVSFQLNPSSLLDADGAATGVSPKGCGRVEDDGVLARTTDGCDIVSVTATSPGTTTVTWPDDAVTVEVAAPERVVFRDPVRWGLDVEEAAHAVVVVSGAPWPDGADAVVAEGARAVLWPVAADGLGRPLAYPRRALETSQPAGAAPQQPEDALVVEDAQDAVVSGTFHAAGGDVALLPAAIDAVPESELATLDLVVAVLTDPNADADVVVAADVRDAEGRHVMQPAVDWQVPDGFVVVSPGDADVGGPWDRTEVIYLQWTGDDDVAPLSIGASIASLEARADVDVDLAARSGAPLADLARPLGCSSTGGHGHTVWGLAFAAAGLVLGRGRGRLRGL